MPTNLIKKRARFGTCDGCYYANKRDGDWWIDECVDEHQCIQRDRDGEKRFYIFEEEKK